MGRKLSRSFYSRQASTVAPELLGMHLISVVGEERRVGRIVEAEAYEGPHDQAAHSANGRRTARTEVMFGEPGRAYIYLIYGMYHCFNVVTARRDEPEAVLIRALEPIAGVEKRTQGPGLLCSALGIDKSHNDLSLRGERLWIEKPSPSKWIAPSVKSSPRIGIGYAGSWARKPWRFFDVDSDHVSKMRR